MVSHAFGNAEMHVDATVARGRRVSFGVGGGAFVSWVALDINPTVFFNRIQEFVPIENFWVGMSKAPVFGMIVALVGCRQGLLVGGSVQSLGRSTTKSVVQALFSKYDADDSGGISYKEFAAALYDGDLEREAPPPKEYFPPPPQERAHRPGKPCPPENEWMKGGTGVAHALTGGRGWAA